jgi:hypothetical protein
MSPIALLMWTVDWGSGENCADALQQSQLFPILCERTPLRLVPTETGPLIETLL